MVDMPEILMFKILKNKLKLELMVINKKLEVMKKKLRNYV